MATPNIDNAAALPAEAQTGAGRVKQHDLDKQLQYDLQKRHAVARAVNPGLPGVIFTKIIPAAPMPDQQGTGTGGTSFDTPGL